MNLANGKPYIEGMTVWQWGHVPIAPPFIQSYENTRLSAWPDMVVLDDETWTDMISLYVSYDEALTALKIHLITNRQNYERKISNLRQDADSYERWLKESDDAFAKLG